MLRTRILTAIVLLAAIGALLFEAPNDLWNASVLFFGLLGSWEWSALARFPALTRLVYVGATALLSWALFHILDYAGSRTLLETLYGLSALFWVMMVPFWLLKRWHVTSVSGLALVGWIVVVPTIFALMTLKSTSPWVLLLFMAVLWVSDTAAYFAGRAFGKRKLAPAISPGKTWEGVAGALGGVLVYAVAVGIWAAMTPGQSASMAVRTIGIAWIPLILLLAVLGILGDLFESWIKRCAGVKDSGRLLPGHGGILDRIDALTATLPLAALLMLENGGWHHNI